MAAAVWVGVGSHLPPDVCELGEEQRQVEGQLQDVVVVDVHRQRLRGHTTTAECEQHRHRHRTWTPTWTALFFFSVSLPDTGSCTSTL